MKNLTLSSEIKIPYRTVLRMVFCLFFLLPLVHFALAQTKKKNPKIHGQIRDMRTNQVIPGMMIEFHRDSVQGIIKRRKNKFEYARDKDGKIIQDTVLVADSIFKTVKSKVNGHFESGSLSTVTYRLVVWKPGYVGLAIENVQLQKGDSLFFDLTLESGSQYEGRTDTILMSDINQREQKLASKCEEKNLKFTSGTTSTSIGVINDAQNWDHWVKLMDNSFETYSGSWEIYPTRRYKVHIINKDGQPLPNMEVELLNQLNETIWRTKTDPDGNANLWDNFFKLEKASSQLSIKVSKGMDFRFIAKPLRFEQGINDIVMDQPVFESKSVDIAFVLDATASMDQKLEWFKFSVDKLVKDITAANQDLNIRIAGVSYRDYNDRYIVQNTQFANNPKKSVEFLMNVTGYGGAEYAEAMEMGLMTATSELNWDKGAKEKIIVLLTDAHGHNTFESNKTLYRAIASASTKGIRIIPVTCGNTDRNTEFLLRTIALGTNGFYTFTSGIDKAVDIVHEPYAEGALKSDLTSTLNNILRNPSGQGSARK